jgi:ElaB/YqjD/DUF883 family membrane-anchored ribosome-binding protein
MTSRDIYEAVVAITHPLPDREDFAAHNAHLSAEDQDLVFQELLQEVMGERERVLADLHEQAQHAAEADDYVDPLLAEIDACRDEMLRLERTMRLLIAYAREYVRPHPYQLKDLARAAGMSISGVRIAYDEDEVREVGELTGDKPRRPLPAETP